MAEQDFTKVIAELKEKTGKDNPDLNDLNKELGTEVASSGPMPGSGLTGNEPVFGNNDPKLEAFLKARSEAAANKEKLASAEGNENNPDNKGSSEAGKGQPQEPTTFYDNVAETLNKYLPDGEKLNKGDVTSENYLELTLTSMMPRVMENYVSPEALKYDEYIKQGGDPEEFFKAGSEYDSILSMDKDALLLHDYMAEFGKSEENPDGLSEEVIKERLASMNEFDKVKEYKERVSKYKNLRDQAKNAKVEAAAQARKQQLENDRIDILKEVDEVIKSSKDIQDFYGLKVDPNAMAEWNIEFRELMTPDENGIRPASKVFRDNKELYKLLYLATRKDGIKGYLTEAQNQRVKELKETLSPEARSRSSKSAGASQGLDFDALSRPDNGLR